jgi:hypothetical protein
VLYVDSEADYHREADWPVAHDEFEATRGRPVLVFEQVVYGIEAVIVFEAYGVELLGASDFHNFSFLIYRDKPRANQYSSASSIGP